VPPGYAHLFHGQRALLNSHRGWDIGALELARRLAGAADGSLHVATTTRLLIDLNRSPRHPQLYSELTRGLPAADRRTLVEHHYRPYREAVEGEILRRAAVGNRVIHVSSHSFTPVFNGVTRAVDVAWLYDPRRPGEVAFVQWWRRALSQRAPGLRLRRNYPYQGRADGLTATLRRKLPSSAYVGIEIEVNQALVGRHAAWPRLQALLADSLRTALAATAGRPPGHRRRSHCQQP
jgi:predicted N-formylglutamate amidohydrolase